MTAPHTAPRVLHATECLAAGTLQVMRAMAAALAQRGVEQTVVYSRREESPADVPALFPAGVRLIEVPRASGHHAAFVGGLARALRQQCRDWRPQHVHLHSSKAGFVGRLALRGLQPAPRVYYSPHGLSFLDPRRPVANRVYRWLERWADSAAVQAVACGHGEGRLLEALTGRRAVVIENPVDESFFEVPAWQRGRCTVVTVGRLSRQKAPEVFAAAATELRRHLPHARLVWVGDGDAGQRHMLEACGCEVTGWLPREAVAQWLARADVYLQTSRWEGLPLAVLQAMAAGLPCVVTDVIGNHDAVRHGHSGLVAAGPAGLADALRLLLSDAPLRERMGAQARAEARRRFSEAAFGMRLSQLYGLSHGLADAASAPAAPAPALGLPGRTVPSHAP